MIFREYRILRITDSYVDNKIIMRFIFSLFGLLIALCYKVESVELRCRCSNGSNHPVFGVFWVGYKPPDPTCDKTQHFLLPPRQTPVCLSPDHYLSKWVDGKRSNWWHKVFVKKNTDNGPHIEDKSDTNRHPPWRL